MKNKTTIVSSIVLCLILIAICVAGCAYKSNGPTTSNSSVVAGDNDNVSSNTISDTINSNESDAQNSDTPTSSDVSSKNPTNTSSENTSSSSNSSNTSSNTSSNATSNSSSNVSSNTSSNTTSNNVSSQKPVHTHSYTSQTTKEVTCEKNGIITYTCSCGHSYTKTIERPGHNWSNWKVIREATTSQTGLKTRMCSRCGEVEEETAPKLVDETSLDPRIKVVQYPRLISYEIKKCHVKDYRTWGTPPEITLFEGDFGTCMRVVYYNQNNEKIEFDVYALSDDRLSLGAIRDDGTYGLGTTVEYS